MSQAPAVAAAPPGGPYSKHQGTGGSVKIGTEQLQNWKGKETHLASHAYHRIRVRVIQFLYLYTMYMSDCHQTLREALARVQQRAPHLHHSIIDKQPHRTAQT